MAEGRRPRRGTSLLAMIVGGLTFGLALSAIVPTVWPDRPRPK